MAVRYGPFKLDIPLGRRTQVRRTLFKTIHFLIRVTRYDLCATSPPMVAQSSKGHERVLATLRPISKQGNPQSDTRTSLDPWAHNSLCVLLVSVCKFLWLGNFMSKQLPPRGKFRAIVKTKSGFVRDESFAEDISFTSVKNFNGYRRA